MAAQDWEVVKQFKTLKSLDLSHNCYGVDYDLDFTPVTALTRLTNLRVDRDLNCNLVDKVTPCEHHRNPSAICKPSSLCKPISESSC